MLKKAYVPKQQDISSLIVIGEMKCNTQDVKNDAPHHTAVNIADLHDNNHSVVHSDTHTTTVEVEKPDDTQYTEPGATYSAAIKIEDIPDMECSETCIATVNLEGPHNTQSTEHSGTCTAAVNIGVPHNNIQNMERSGSSHTAVNIINICSVCGKGFFILSDIKTHMTAHTGAVKNKSSSCLIKFCDGYNIVYPPGVEESHNTQGAESSRLGHPAVKLIHMCIVCGARFITLSGVKTHMTTHTGAVPNKSSISFIKLSKCDPIVCPPGVTPKEQREGVWDTIMSDNGSVLSETHVVITPAMTPKQNKPDNSPECDQDFLSHVTDLNTHSQTHDGEKLTSDSVDISSQACKINAHAATVGTPSVHAVGIKTEVQEDTQTLQTKTTEQFNSGMKRIDLSTEKTCVKSNSDGGFTASGNISTGGTVCTKEPFHVCSDCGKVFSTTLALTIHKKIHIGEKTYVCSDCGKRFSQEGGFKQHVMTHRGERPHICPDCGQEFTRILQLLQHMRTHTGENLHMCLHCGDGFSDPGSLKAHMKTHTGDKHYANDSHPILVCKGETDNDTQDVKNSAPHHTAVNIADLHDNAHSVVHTDTHTTTVEVEKPDDTQYTGPGDTYSAAVKVEDSHNNMQGTELSETCSASVNIEEPHNTQNTEHGGRVFSTVNIDGAHKTQGAECSGSGRTAPVKIINICSVCGKGFSTLSDVKTHMTSHTEAMPNYLIKFCSNYNVVYPPRVEEPHNTQGTDHSASLRAAVKIIHKCAACGKGFTLLSDIKTHMTTHTGAVPNKSSISFIKFCKRDTIVCPPGVTTKEQGEGFRDKVMTTPSTLQTVPSQVTDTMSENGPELSGNFIGITTSTTDQLNSQNHLKTHTGVMVNSYACCYCGKAFLEKESLRIHTRVHNREEHMLAHTQRRRHLCSKCGKQFKTLNGLKTHMMTHIGARPHVCNNCGRGFSTPGSLKMHMRLHTGEKPYVCEYCDKGYTQLISLKLHVMSHTGERPHVCSHCGKGFCTKQGLNIHMTKHTGEKPYVCSECGKAFGMKQQLQQHIRMHTGEAPYLCSHCGKVFETNEKFQQHMRMHTGEKPYLCSHCGKRFRLKQSLRIHIRQHTGEKPHHCSHCNKCFSTTNGLNFHMMYHTGKWAHVCSECGKGFSQKGGLKYHMTTHTGDKHHVCADCGKGFSTNQNLKIHMRSHTGVKSHTCSDCGKGFSLLDSLTKHMETHEAEKD